MIPPLVLQELCELFTRYPEIEQTFLFGSRARGDFTDRSDIDLIVKAPTISRESWVDLVYRLTEDVNTLLGIDVVRWEDAPEALRQRVHKEGRLLYERKQDSRQSP